ncbi:amino acid permease [Streptomyces sp. NPDC001508]|uniref:amino acid permease n=1 Tax=Streptomyces sp. NPDC001508 TaxID=3154656 RepID=UPI003316EEE7
MSDKVVAAPSVGEGSLKRSVGPTLLWGVGVGAVISGDYYGWNTGLDLTGYWGYLIAIAIMGLLYACLSAVIGELAAAIPHSGGAYAYVRTALGRIWGYFAGVSVLLEFVFAPVAVALAVGGYVHVLFPNVPIWLSAVVLYAVSTVVHLAGAGGSLKVEFLVTGLAVLGLVVFMAIGLPKASLEHLNAYSSGAVFPHGIGGLWATLPYAAWFFFAIESLPMSAEEARNPGKDIPRALATAFITLAVVGVGTLTVAAGVGDHHLPGATAPITVALSNVIGAQGWISPVIAVFSIIALVASFHAIVLAYSRQMFALSRARYLPTWISTLTRNQVPLWGLVLPGLVGLVFVFVGTAMSDSIPVLVSLSVLVAAVSYILMMVAALVLRRSRPDLNRPYRARGGKATMWIGAVLSAVLIPAALWNVPLAFGIAVAVFALAFLLYMTYGRHRTANISAEQELAALDAAEDALRTHTAPADL